MIRAELVNKLSQRMNISKKNGELYFAAFIDSIVENLKIDGRVVFRGFGSFKINEYKARIARKPLTGEFIKLPIRRKVSFRPGHELRQKINSEMLEENNNNTLSNHSHTSENILTISP